MQEMNPTIEERRRVPHSAMYGTQVRDNVSRRKISAVVELGNVNQSASFRENNDEIKRRSKPHLVQPMYHLERGIHFEGDKILAVSR